MIKLPQKEIQDSFRNKVTVNNKKNPFITQTNTNVRFHPFLDYSSAHGHKGSYDNDFFGFRNDKNHYFKDRSFDDVMIVMTGGSECAGYSHPEETISQNLQKKLQKRTAKNVIVLNLCMNSYVLAHEMQAYLHLAYQLKPDLVITHSGYNDSIYGILVSEEFLKVGLIYNKWQELWLKPLYGSVKVEDPNVKDRDDVFSSFHPENVDMIVTAIWNQVKKYNHIATKNGSRFLLGLQGYNTKIDYSNKLAAMHEVVHKVMRRLSNTLPENYHAIDFTRIYNIEYADSVHSEQDSVELISSIYEEYIISTFPEIIENKE